MQNLKLGYGTSVSLFEIVIKNNSIKLIKEISGFLEPQLGRQHLIHLCIHRYPRT